MVIMYDEKKKLRRNKQKGVTHHTVHLSFTHRLHFFPTVRTVFLFTDVFLLTKHIPSSGTYHLKFVIYLNPSVHIEHNPYVKGIFREADNDVESYEHFFPRCWRRARWLCVPTAQWTSWSIYCMDPLLDEALLANLLFSVHFFLVDPYDTHDGWEDLLADRSWTDFISHTG